MSAVRPHVSVMIESVREFCTDYGLPDVSPLIDGGLSDKERYAVVWRVLQQELDAPEQVEFLRTLCKCGSSEKLPMFEVLLSPDMDLGRRNSFFQILMMEGVEFDKGIKEFGSTRKLGGIVTFTQKQGFESVVSGIKASFRVASEPMQYALDKLDYKANPVKFVKTIVGEIAEMESHENIFNSKWKLLGDEIRKISKEEADLKEQLNLLGSGGSSSRTPFAAERGTGPKRHCGARGGK